MKSERNDCKLSWDPHFWDSPHLKEISKLYLLLEVTLVSLLLHESSLNEKYILSPACPLSSLVSLVAPESWHKAPRGLPHTACEAVGTSCSIPVLDCHPGNGIPWISTPLCLLVIASISVTACITALDQECTRERGWGPLCRDKGEEWMQGRRGKWVGVKKIRRKRKKKKEYLLFVRSERDLLVILSVEGFCLLMLARWRQDHSCYIWGKTAISVVYTRKARTEALWGGASEKSMRMRNAKSKSPLDVRWSHVNESTALTRQETRDRKWKKGISWLQREATKLMSHFAFLLINSVPLVLVTCKDGLRTAFCFKKPLFSRANGTFGSQDSRHKACTSAHIKCMYVFFPQVTERETRWSALAGSDITTSAHTSLAEASHVTMPNFKRGRN